MKNSRQINFYLHDQDLLLLENYLQKIGFQFIADRMPTPTFIILNSLKRQKSEPQRLLVLANQTDKIQFLTSQTDHRIDQNISPIISVWVGGYHAEKNMFFRGRLFYQTHFLQDGEWQKHQEEFLKKAEQLFKWFKRHFIYQKEGIFTQCYTSEAVLQAIQKQNAKIVYQQTDKKIIFADYQGVYETP